MLDRRDFMQGAAITTATAATGLSVGAARAATMSFHKVIFDEDFDQSRLFGAAAQRLGAKVYSIRGDVTKLWYDHLYHRWRRSPAAIAGMTQHASLFVLEMMAADAGLRVIHRTHHQILSDGSMVHEAFGPAAHLRRTWFTESPSTLWQSAWACRAAQIIMSWPADAARISKAHSNIIEARLRAVAPNTLISWIIAPVERGPDVFERA